jgi:cytochrome c peroxidase
MKKHISTLVSLSVIGITSIAFAQSDNDLLNQAKSIFSPLPDKITPPKDNPITPEKVKLGKKLYFEKKLSIDNTISCNSCHLLDKFGVDNQSVSTGVKGQKGGRNAPTVYNAGLHFAQFWDGRAKDLEEQAGGPILNPIEMGMPNENEVLKRLKSDSSYVNLFKIAFKGEKEPITYKNITKAIASFERTLLTPSKFDKFLKGDKNALNNKEKEGLRTFMSKGCTSCHNGVTVGGQMFQKFGLVSPYQYQKDLGRFEVTKNENDKFVFKVPSLRNVAKTSPYFHDGKVKDLKEAIKTMGKTQLGINLTNKEIENIEAFLNSLTGDIPKI